MSALKQDEKKGNGVIPSKKKKDMLVKLREGETRIKNFR